MGIQKKWVPLPEPVKKKTSTEPSDNVVQKAEIERMKQLISEKMKDPKMAKKAALIIAEIINSKGEK